MRLIYILLFLTLSQSIFAAPQRRDLLYCLGQEEEKLHKGKRTGPQYFLNQYFINEAASMGNFKLKESYYKEICVVKEFPPSIALMKSILINEQKIFAKVQTNSSHLNALYTSGLDSLVQSAPHIFFQFLSIIQTQTRYAHCFKENIPELHKLMQDYQYLEEDVSPKDLIKNKKNITLIFDKLKYLDAIYDRCEKKYDELLSKIKTKN